MTTSRRRAAPGLGEFLDALETRLRTLGAEGIVAALIAHAQRLPASSRQEFLAIFPRPGTRPPAPYDDQLLADIDAFTRRAKDGEFDGSQDRYDDGYDDPFYDDYPDGGHVDAEWVQEADGLFAMAGEAFLAGRLDLAHEAYRRLFALFRPIHQGGSDLDTWMLETTDVGEATARYLRCVYETSPPDQRGTAVYREYTALSPSLGSRRPLLRDIATARRGDLPNLETFLRGWIDALLAETTALPTGHRRRLLTEATLLHGGLGGLADLARRPGSHQPGTYQDWIDALTEAGQVSQAADAAREALTLTPAVPGPHAQAADRLADLTTRLGDPAGAVDARRQAWRVAPTRGRLLALAAAAEAAGTQEKILAAEARNARAGTDRLTCELFLLAGQGDAAAAALTRAQPRGWSNPAHPGPVVLPYLLVAATAAAPPPAANTHLGRLFADIDTLALAPNYHDLEFGGDDEEFDTTSDEVPDESAGSQAGSLVALLTSQIAQAPAPARRRQQWLATAATVIERRVETIVGNKNRRAYARAASLVVAYAETLIITGTGDGHDYIASVRQRYPRHTAFRAELDDAAHISALARRAR